MKIDDMIAKITLPDEKARSRARSRLDSLIKPIGSLGRLEDLAVRLAGISSSWNRRYEKKTIVVMCSDNGVYEEGVSSAPKETTLLQSLNFRKGITGVGALSKLSGSDLHVVDIGIDADLESNLFLNRKIRRGTSNLAKAPAMSRDEARRALETGFEEVKILHENGYSVVGTGEMGLGNTTTASLVLMALTGRTAEETAGKGAGLTEEAFAHKKKILAQAMEFHEPDKNDPIDVLSKVGGFDIAGLVGVFLGAARFRMPVVIDGVISAAAALLAYKMCENARHYMIPSHESEEPGYSVAMNMLDMKPYFHLDMRLGEGSGCPLTFLLIDAAQNIINDMATFEQLAMDDKYLIDIRESDTSR